MNYSDIMSEAYAQMYENQYKGETSFNPQELAKQFPRNSGVGYNKTKKTKDHTTAYPTATTSDGKEYQAGGLEPIGGTVTKNKYSPSFARGGHQRNVNQMKKIDKLVKSVQKDTTPKPKFTNSPERAAAQNRRMEKSPYASKLARRAHQEIEKIRKEAVDPTKYHLALDADSEFNKSTLSFTKKFSRPS